MDSWSFLLDGVILLSLLAVSYSLATGCTTDQRCYGCSISDTCNFIGSLETPALDNCIPLLSDGSVLGVWYNRNESMCYAYGCTEWELWWPGSVAYRHTCNTDCPVFELFYLEHYQGNGDILNTETGVSLSDCLITCADLPGCRGITIDNVTNTCTYHDSSSHVPLNRIQFVEKRCVVTMEEIEEGYAACEMTNQVIHGTKSGDICQTPKFQTLRVKTYEACFAQMIPHLELGVALEYDITKGMCSVYDCHYLGIGNPSHPMNIVRMSCTSDCPEYRTAVFKNKRGNSEIIARDRGDVTLGGCMTRCFDMTGCRGVSYKAVDNACTYHIGTSFSTSQQHVFVARTCVTTVPIVRNGLQECTNCRSSCAPLVSISIVSGVEMSSHCDLQCPSCQSALLSAGICRSYQCDVSGKRVGNQRLLRKTNNTECRKFKIHMMTRTTASCLLDQPADQFFTESDCINRCMDLPGCRSADFNRHQKTCTYFNCSIPEPGPGGSHFIQKECEEECTILTQTCINCRPDSTCPANGLDEAFTADNCSALIASCNQSVTCEMVHVITATHCVTYQCQIVTPQIGQTVHRKSCNADCPVYEVYIQAGKVGGCPVMFSEMFVTEGEMCLARCLDTASCRGVTYSTRDNLCTYHSCDCDNGTMATGNNAGNTFFYTVFCLNDTQPTNAEWMNVCNPPTTTTWSTEATTATTAFISTTTTPTTTASTTISTTTTTPTTTTTLPSTTTTTPTTTTATLTTTTTTILTTTATAPTTTTTAPAATSPSTTMTPAPTITATTMITTTTSATTPTQTTTQLTTSMATTPTEATSTLTTSSTTTTPTTTSTTPTAPSATPTTTTMPPTTTPTTLPTTILATSLTTPPTMTTASASTGITAPAANTPTATPTSNATTTTTSTPTENMAAPAAPLTTAASSSTTAFMVPTVITTGGPSILPIYIMPCTCSTGMFSNLTVEEVTERIIVELAVDNKNTSSARRKLTSANDRRSSAAAVGFVGSAVLGVVSLFVLIIDASSVYIAVKKDDSKS